MTELAILREKIGVEKKSGKKIELRESVAYPAHRCAGLGLQIFITKKFSRDKIDLTKVKQKAKSYPQLQVVFSAMCSVGKPLSVQ